MTDATDSPRTRPRGESRRRAMIDAAWQVMQEKGCEAATVTDVIALSGGSRATLYAAFGGKDGLIEAAVAERCGAFGESMQLVLDEESDPRSVLETLGRAFLAKVLSPESARTLGIFVAEGARFPEMIEAFLRHGPGELKRRIAAYLARETRAGRLAVDDPELAADLFLSMLQGQWVLRLIARSDAPPDPEAVRRRVRGAVSMFLDGVAARR